MGPKRVLQVKPHTRISRAQASRRGRGAANVVSLSELQPEESFADVDPQAIAEAPVIPALLPNALTVVCVINGKQNMSLIMEHSDALQAIEAPAIEDIQHKPLFNGRLEIEVIWMMANDRTPQHRQGFLIIDDDVVLDLGPLQTTPVQCAVLVTKFPKKFVLQVRTVPVPAMHPAEALLSRAVRAILDNEEFMGSMTVSHLQNLVRDLPFYVDVVGPLRGAFMDFLLAHTEHWRMFKYEAATIEHYGMQQSVRDNECRVVSRKLEDVYVEGDRARTIIRDKCERELHAKIKEKLSNGPVSQGGLQNDLLQENCFTTLIAPNFVKIMEAHAAQSDKYFVMFDRLHDVFIEERRTDVVDPFLERQRAAQRI